ncbi:MAG: flagellar basal body L-ring protein FlgH [Betaproteobacteria bacterium]|nr:flagellar basal body L-ring protein FlgH [Betaproteobacteria bacterium]
MKTCISIAPAGAACAALLLAGCITTTPATSVHQPMTVRPLAPAPAQNVNGAIYQAGYGYRPMFEDRRARNVGDTLTINIVENTSADKKSNTTTNRSSDNNLAVPNVSGLPGKSFMGAGLAATTDMKFSGDGQTTSNNVFTGTISVTVIEVFANGNLLVSGEKQVGINHASEFIRFSGVVNPNNISAVNSVNSVQVADARVEYRGSGQIENAQNMGWMSRFFLNVLPF